MTGHPLVELFGSAAVNSFSSTAKAFSHLTTEFLRSIYDDQVKASPRRGTYRQYFVAHSGKTTSGRSTNRREEHLAIALWVAYREGGFTLPDGERLYPLDYQLPLKSHRNELNAGIGKVDLFCVDDHRRPWIVELKIRTSGVDTPLKAALEALAYCAILEADLQSLSNESLSKKDKLGRTVAVLKPNLLVLAPAEYWAVCDGYEDPYPWRQNLRNFSDCIQDGLGIQVRFVKIRDCAWHAPDGRPTLTTSPTFEWAISHELVPNKSDPASVAVRAKSV